MQRTMMVAALFLVLSGVAVLPASGGTHIKVYRINKPVAVDGVLDEAAWLHLPTVTGFIYVNQRDTYSGLQTAFQVGYDREHLYLGIRADEPKMKEHLEHAQKKDTREPNWKFQMFELFLDVPRQDGTTDHYQFAMDILGNRALYKADLEGKPFRVRETKWHLTELPWKGAVRPGSDYFGMEMAFPFKAFGVPPKNCDEWGCQVGRHGTSWPRAEALEGLHWKVASWTAWVPMPSGRWRAVGEHGTLEFADEVLLPDYQNVGKKTEEINKDYYAWKATHGEAMQKVRALVKKTEGLTDLCYGEDGKHPAACIVFGKRRGPPPRKKVPNWTWQWWFTETGNPQTALLEWKEPVTFNCNKIRWNSPTCYAQEYALEYWTGTEWRLAYQETNNLLPLSGHAFPTVTTTKARLTIARVAAPSWNVPVPGFELYLVPGEQEAR